MQRTVARTAGCSWLSLVRRCGAAHAAAAALLSLHCGRLAHRLAVASPLCARVAQADHQGKGKNQKLFQLRQSSKGLHMLTEANVQTVQCATKKGALAGR